MFDFLNLRPQAFGFDISDFSVKTARLKEMKGGYRLSSYGEHVFEKGLVKEGAIQDTDALAKHLREAVRRIEGEKLDTNYVVASLPEERAFVQVIQLPRMEEESVGAAVRFEAENHIPYPLDTVYLNHKIIPSFGAAKDHLDVLLVSLPKEIVDPYVEVLRKADFQPLVLETESVSIARALIKGGVAPRPILIVDLGLTRASVSVFSGRSLRFVSSIPISSDEFTKAIMRTLEVDREKAEEYKYTYGVSSRNTKEGKEIFSALVPSLTDFAEQLRTFLTYYESHANHQHLPTKDAKIAQIMLSGGGALLKGLPEFLARELRVDVVLGNPWANILSEDIRELPPVPFRESLKYTTALGLALQGAQGNRIYDND